MVKDKRMFASCITDAPHGKQTSDSTWDGKCMYYDEAKIKALLAKAQTTQSEPSKEEQAAMYVDTGLTCKVTATGNGPVAVTNPGTFPTGLEKATLKSTVSAEDASAFEGRYMEFLSDAYMKNTLGEYDQRVQSMYDFPAATTAPAPIPAPAPAAVAPVVAATPVATESAWSPARIALLVIMILIGITMMIMLVIWIFKDTAAAPAPVGGKRMRLRK